MNRNQNIRPPQIPQRQAAHRPANGPSAQRRKYKDKREVFLAKLLIYLVALAVIMVIIVICIGCKHNQTDTPAKTDSKITVDYGDTNVDENARITTFLQNDVLYVNFSQLAIQCEMTITGSDKEQTFSVKNGETTETMVIKADSLIAVINGVEVNMPYKALLRNSSIWLSADFITKAVHGVTVNYNKDTKVLTCKRTELNASTPANPLYENVTFAFNVTQPIETLKDPDTSGQIGSTDTGRPSGDTNKAPETEKPPQTEKPKYDFLLDLSAYEQYMDPANRDDYLTLSNKNKYLDSDYVPKNLTKVYKATSSADRNKMVYVAAMAFEAMVKEGDANGLNIKPLSGYRSYSTQKYTFQNWLNIEINNAKKNDPSLTEDQAYDIGYSVASMYSAPAGASEHQLGLAMDVNSLEESFGSTPEGRWLAANCYKFGFILRYPEGKTDITGYIYEPWHFRFVGRYHAERMTKLNMCLEEYLAYINKT